MSTYERIREKQSSRRKSFFKKIVIFFLFCAFIAGGYYALRQPQFAFGIIYISGNEQLARDDILFLTGLKEPVNLFLLDKTELENTLIKDARIKNAKIAYDFPNVVRIMIEEEKPVFYIACNYGYISVSSKKEVLSADKSIKSADAPIVSGLSGKNLFVGDIIDDNKMLHIFDFLDSLDALSRSRISEVNVFDSTSIKIIDLSGRPYFLGDIQAMQSKAPTFAALVKEFSEKNLAVEFVDLSYAKPYIKIKQ